LVETFPHKDQNYLCVFGFAGRNAQQTLGLLLTNRMETLGTAPMGFVATDYATLIWGLDKIDTPEDLFDKSALQNGFETWLSSNAVMKQAFRSVATIAGLIERNLLGLRKSGRQASFSSDILYDTLRKYDPDHLLMRIAQTEALSGLVDYGRINAMLERVGDRIEHRHLPHVSPFAAPLLLEVGRIHIQGEGIERILDAETKALFQAAGLKE
jgi:ATP-dependent Lhr-like helicase